MTTELIVLGWRISTDTGCAACRRVEERLMWRTHTHTGRHGLRTTQRPCKWAYTYLQTRPLLIKTRPPRPSKLRLTLLTGYSTNKIHLIKGYISLHSCQILSLSETGYIVSAHRLLSITLLTLIATLLLEGESPTYILNQDTQPVIYARSEYHTQLAKMSFDKIFDLAAGVYFRFSKYILFEYVP